jgi:hypothetical protein
MQIGWPIAIGQPSNMEVDKKIFFHLFDLAIVNSYLLTYLLLGA